MTQENLHYQLEEAAGDYAESAEIPKTAWQWKKLPVLKGWSQSRLKPIFKMFMEANEVVI